jgi:hypothetical protein
LQLAAIVENFFPNSRDVSTPAPRDPRLARTPRRTGRLTMRQLATLILVVLGFGTYVVAGHADGQAASPYTPQEATTLSSVWRTIRGAAHYEDIDWQAIGVASEPGSAEARRLIAQNWTKFRGAAKFEAINWSAATGAPTATAAPASTAPTAKPATAASRASVPGSPPPAANAGTIAGTWVGTLETYPNFLRMTLDLPAIADASSPAQGTLRIDGGLGPQGAPKGQTSVGARFDAGSRTLTLTIGQDGRSMRLPVGELHGYLDTRSETVAGVVGNAFADSSPFFVLARERTAEERIFKPIEAGMNQQQQRAGPFGALGQRSGTDRGDLERWARRVIDEYPDVDPARVSPDDLFAMARNLFADEHFQAHFKTTFDKMDGGDRLRILTGIRAVPFGQGNTPDAKTDNVIRTVERPFMQMVGTGTASDMTLSVIAMRYMAAWRQGAIAELAQGADTLDAFRAASGIDNAAVKLAPYVWPSERAALATATTASLDRASRAPLVAEVDKLLASATGIAGARAIDAALKTNPDPKPKSALELAPRTPPRQPSYAQPGGPGVAQSKAAAVSLAELAKWAPATWAAQKPRLNSGLDDLLAKQVADARATLGLDSGSSAAAANPTERLQKSRAWYQSHRDLVGPFSSRGTVAKLVTDLAAQRDADFAALLPQMSAHLASLTTVAEVQSYGRDLVTDLDHGGSGSWQRFEQQRSARIVELDRAAAVARIGAGPFGPEHPGAAYLNALYRNDTARLAQEDRDFAQRLGGQMTKMLQQTGMDALTSFFSGGVIPQGGLSQLMQASVNQYTIAEPVAGFFIVAYERVYPKCMDKDPVHFVETITWDTVVTNGLGTTVYPHEEVNYYNVNHRHAAAFQKVGTPPDQDKADFTAKLFAPFLPKDVAEPLQTASDAVRGMGMAMSENACDSPVMKAIEKNLIAYVMAK